MGCLSGRSIRRPVCRLPFWVQQHFPISRCGTFRPYLFLRSLVLVMPLLLFHFTEPYGPLVPPL
jgi:hypothetical protein